MLCVLLRIACKRSVAAFAWSITEHSVAEYIASMRVALPVLKERTSLKEVAALLS